MSDQSINPVIWQFNQERRQELVQVSATSRLLKQATGRGSRTARLLTGIGDILVSLGMKLKVRYDPVLKGSGG